MNKKECEKALEMLYDGQGHKSINGGYLTAYGLISCLINEYFDNPSLKFEEIKPNMWIWDNKYKMYTYIQNIDSEDKTFNVEKFMIDGEPWYSYDIYEDNKYFRYEVKEND